MSPDVAKVLLSKVPPELLRIVRSLGYRETTTDDAWLCYCATRAEQELGPRLSRYPFRFDRNLANKIDQDAMTPARLRASRPAHVVTGMQERLTGSMSGEHVVLISNVASLIARISERGVQPFLPALMPVDTDTSWYPTLNFERVFAHVAENEDLYREAATRWLITAHFYSELLEYSDRGIEGTKSTSLFTFFPRYVSDESAAEGVSILRKWWPWFEAVRELDKKRYTKPSDWKYIAGSLGPVALGGLR